MHVLPACVCVNLCRNVHSPTWQDLQYTALTVVQRLWVRYVFQLFTAMSSDVHLANGCGSCLQIERRRLWCLLSPCTVFVVESKIMRLRGVAGTEPSAAACKANRTRAFWGVRGSSQCETVKPKPGTLLNTINLFLILLDALCMESCALVNCHTCYTVGCVRPWTWFPPHPIYHSLVYCGAGIRARFLPTRGNLVRCSAAIVNFHRFYTHRSIGESDVPSSSCYNGMDGCGVFIARLTSNLNRRCGAPTTQDNHERTAIVGQIGTAGVFQ